MWVDLKALRSKLWFQGVLHAQYVPGMGFFPPIFFLNLVPVGPYLIQLPVLVVDTPPTTPFPRQPGKLFTIREADTSSPSHIVSDPVAVPDLLYAAILLSPCWVPPSERQANYASPTWAGQTRPWQDQESNPVTNSITLLHGYFSHSPPWLFNFLYLWV